MARVYFPPLYEFDKRVPRSDWPHTKIVRDGASVTVQWKDEPGKILGPLRRIRSYTEYLGEPLFVGDDRNGMVVGYRDEYMSAGKALQGGVGIVQDQVFYVPQMGNGWSLVWNGLEQSMLGRQIIRSTLDVLPHANGQDFDATYLAHEGSGLMAVHNDDCSRVFDRITHYSYQGDRLLVCGMKILPHISDPDATQKWFVDLGDDHHGPYPSVFGFTVDLERKKIWFYSGDEQSAERVEIKLTA